MDAFTQSLLSEQGPRLKFDVCYCGDPRMGIDLLRSLRALKPQDDSVRVMSYLEAQAAGGFLQTPVAHFQTNLALRELSDAAIAAITVAINNAPATCQVIIVALRGAVTRVSLSDMAFALRQPGYEVDITGVWSTPAEKANTVRWIQTRATICNPSLRECTSTSWAIRASSWSPRRTAELCSPRSDQRKSTTKERVAAQPKHQTE
jgi:hypothetical protein